CECGQTLGIVEGADPVLVPVAMIRIASFEKLLQTEIETHIGMADGQSPNQRLDPAPPQRARNQGVKTQVVFGTKCGIAREQLVSPVAAKRDSDRPSRKRR